MNIPFLHSMKAAGLCLLIAFVLISGQPADAATLTTGNLLTSGRPQAGWGLGYTNTSSTNLQNAQSITTTVAGVLDNIGVEIYNTGLAIDDLTLSIYTAVGGVPGTLIGSVTEPIASFPSGTNITTTIDFSGLGIFLSPSTQYVLTASVATPLLTNSQYVWTSTTDSGYSGGVPLYNNGGTGDPWQPYPAHNDFVFGVYVNSVPIPPALWLFGSGLLGLVGIARRKKA